MSILFKIDEVFEMAERLEANGAGFYRNAGGRAKDGETRELLLGLAVMEELHLKFFAQRRKEIAQTGTGTSEFSVDDQLSAYLRAWADGHVFDTRVDAVKQLSGNERMEDILRIAIGLEKDSIVFYLGFKDAMTRKTDVAHIEGIIREEMKHIASLNARLAALKGQGA
jgi:rubrerythrin